MLSARWQERRCRQRAGLLHNVAQSKLKSGVNEKYIKSTYLGVCRKEYLPDILTKWARSGAILYLVLSKDGAEPGKTLFGAILVSLE